MNSLVERDARVFAASLSQTEWPSQVMGCDGDLLDPSYVRRLLEQTNPDIILHLAWNVEHGKFWTTRENLDWVGATVNMARAAMDMGVRRFVGVGTCYEYAWPDDAECDEITTQIEPTTLYAVAKDAVRRVLEESHAFSFAWARLFHLFGPFEYEHRLVASLASRLARDEPALLSRGLAVRDFMDVRDAGAALSALALSKVTGAVNIGSGDGASIATIAERLGEISGKSHLVRYGALPDRDGEPPRIVAATRRLREEVGFEPRYSLDQGLSDAYSWWREKFGAAEPRRSS